MSEHFAWDNIYRYFNQVKHFLVKCRLSVRKKWNFGLVPCLNFIGPFWEKSFVPEKRPNMEGVLEEDFQIVVPPSLGVDVFAVWIRGNHSQIRSIFQCLSLHRCTNPSKVEGTWKKIRTLDFSTFHCISKGVFESGPPRKYVFFFSSFFVNTLTLCVDIFNVCLVKQVFSFASSSTLYPCQLVVDSVGQRS